EGSWFRDLRSGHRYAQLRAADELYFWECSIHRDDRARSEAGAVEDKRKIRPPGDGRGWAQAGESERCGDCVVIGRDQNFVSHGQRLGGRASAQVVLPPGEKPTEVGNLREIENAAGGIETVPSGRAGTDVDGAGAGFIDIVSDEKLGREISSVIRIRRRKN